MILLRFCILILLILPFHSACMNISDYEEYIKYLAKQDNGLTISKQINKVDMKLSYRPTEFFVYQELKGRDNLTRKMINDTRNDYKSHYYFLLQLSIDNKEVLRYAPSQQTYSYLINTLSFNMEDKIFLISSKNDTLSLLDYHAPRTYGTAGSTSVIFIFERELDFAEALKLELQEFGLHTGNTRFTFNKNDIVKAERIQLFK